MHAIGLTQLLVYTAFIVVGLGMLYAFRPPPPPKVRGERVNLRKVVDGLNQSCLHDVRIIDQQGRIVCIDHILRLPASVVLIGTVAATAKGEVTGNERTRTWTITHRGSSTSFVNPLLELQPLNVAFKRRFPILRVRGIVVFPDTVNFTGETPKGAVRFCDFQAWVDEIMKMDGTLSSATEQAWPAITSMVASSQARIEQARARGLIGGGDQKPGKKRRKPAIAVAARAR